MSDAPPESTCGPQFSEGQLNRLRTLETDIDCECPRHLADIISSLMAFEEYSARCEVDHRDQAELHRQLASISARARRLVESAMLSLIQTEKIVL